MQIPYEPGEPLTCGQIRELDILAIEHVGVPGLVLMENAGRNVAEFIYNLLVDPQAARVLLLCGPGNNGGDGFVVARQLRNAGVQATTVLAAPRDRSQGDAGVNLRIFDRLGGEIVEGFVAENRESIRDAAERADVIVDALLGTGSRGTPRPPMADLIELANAPARARRVAIDIPTGLDADTGEVAEPCFRADATVTLVAEKVGFAKPAARRVLGRVVVADIGIPRELIPGRRDFGSSSI